MRINLIGGPFQHAHTSTWWKKSKNIEWIKNSATEKNSFYVDDAIFVGLNDTFKGKKFAWILESRAIFSVDRIIKNIDQLLNKYELIFSHNYDIINLNPDKIKFVPGNGFWVESPMIYPKSKLISMVTSNKNITSGQNLRMSFVFKYGKEIDIYGRGFNPIQLKEEGLKNYMFSVAIENDKYDTYFTEKILDCFATGTIPIYYGTEKIAEHFNIDGIIKIEDFDLGSLSADIYNSKIDAVRDNFERVMNLEIPEDLIYEKYLKDYE